MSEPIVSNETLPVNKTVSPSGISHGFDTGYAMAYGVEEAIMIKNFQHFIIANANRGQNFKEGRFWTYDKLEDFPNHFPYWTVKQVRRILASLITQGVMIKGEFNDRWSNRTAWYAFKDQEKFIRNTKVPKTPLPTEPDLPKRANEKCPNGQMSDDQMGNCNIDTTTITPSIPTSSLKVPKEPVEAKASEIEFVPSSKPKREKPDFPPRVREMANQMVNSLIRTKPDYVPPKNLSALLTEVDFILRLDGRDPIKIMDVFNWALSDSFWADKMFKPNPAKYLREKFDQLEMKMIAKPPANPSQPDRRLKDKEGKSVDAYKDLMF
jgi:hypothetical protein